MANYSSLTEAKAAGISNMTILRNNTKNDDGTTTYTVNIDWFKFNGQSLTNLYSSGNSWLGFGANSEQLKVNRRDCAVWNEYSETGYIGETRFFKFTWDGYSYYGQTSSSYHQAWDIFIFDKGIIYLNFHTIPTSYFNGTNSLVCGNQTLTFTPSNESKEWSFLCEDQTTGTNWVVQEGAPGKYAEYGYIEYTFPEVGNLNRIYNGKISWNENIPEGTSITVQAKLNSGSYQDCTNNSFLPINWPSSTLYSILYIKIILETSLRTVTPSIYDLNLTLWDEDSKDKIQLKFNSGTVNSFRNATGGIIVSYNGTGRLEGEGGPVARFSQIFYPNDLLMKPNQNEMEHLSIDVVSLGELIQINWIKGYENEHLSVSVGASGSLINIQDL